MVGGLSLSSAAKYPRTRYWAVRAVDLSVQAQITEIRRIIIDPKVIEREYELSIDSDT